MSRNKNDWRILSSKEIFKAGFFRVRSDELELPNKKVQPRYYVMEFSDWVNIVPLTDKNEIILIKQYRHAVGDICVEIPGGAVNPGGVESPEAAAKRELVEETGYIPEKLVLVGCHEPNPAMINNKLWTYVALGCKKVQEQQLDAYEDIEVFTQPSHEVLEMVKDGRIRHSLVIAGLHFAMNYLNQGSK